MFRIYLAISFSFTARESPCRRSPLLDTGWQTRDHLRGLLTESRGKGTPRRKTKRVHKSSTTDDKKLQTTLKKMNVQPIQAIEEVNMFKEDGNVIHFAAPKGKRQLEHTDWFGNWCFDRLVHASVPSNTFAIYGNGEDKELTELVPGILNQLGPDSLASLRKLAESYQSLQKKEGAGDDKKDDEDEDDIPDLVEGENFEANVE
jgi:nascent polypeptide-associated complex subunit beta